MHHWARILGVSALAMTLSGAQAVRGQATGADTNPGAAAAADPQAAGQGTRLTVQTLIGDAVGDPASPQYSDVADAISKAVNNDVVGARTALEAAVKKNPNLPPAPVLMAKMLLMANQLQAARTELERAVRDFPNDPEAYNLFSRLAMQERQFTDAELLLQKAKSLSDNYKDNAKRKRNFDISVTSGLALVAEAREQWDQSIAYLKQWLELDPDSPIAHQRLGVHLFRQGKGEKVAAESAYKELQAAMKADPKLNAEILLAELFQSNSDATNAKQWVDYAVKKYPNDVRVQLAAANLAAQGNRLDEAIRFADAALKSDPQSQDARLTRAHLARLAGDLAMAESLLEKVHLDQPSNVLASNLLAQVLVDQADTAKRQRGLELAQMNLQAQTEGGRSNRDLMATYAWALFRNNRNIQEAEQRIGQVVQSGQLSPDYAYYVAKILLEPRGRNADGARLLEEALKNPGPFAYRLPASELLAELKKKPDAAPAGSGGASGAVPPVVPGVTPAATPGALPAR